MIRVCLLCVLAWLSCHSNAYAHKMRTVYLEITEVQPGRAFALQKATTIDKSISFLFPSGCRVSFQQVERNPPVRSYQLQCSTSLAGQSLRVLGLGLVISEVVIRVHLSAGRIVSTLLTGNHPSWVIPRQRKSWEILGAYMWMGMLHVLTGWDHLLFLLVLLLLVQSSRLMLLTVTAFTLSHSVTLGLTVLGWLHVSTQAAEACIAWSLVLGAWEVTRRERLSHPDRLGVWMGLLFGFVHGLGFASSLLSIGLPEQAIPTSLFGFNAGVEIGQLLFVIPSFFLVRVLRRSLSEKPVLMVGSYLVGLPGSYWLWERVVAML